ncbi:MerR family transcriptional regulator [Anaerocolumna aminovalerica]|uniref:DNA-binding transcriptional regulator, MerR family n=1 Tax=Anaerocolumna aminovalerica TaxID=1527 RepID=A0A1I5HX17_9FIRM|nr:MerR family transcriptional regulator [Anaerocolumna aminovalerica]MDU6265629.1 MerR family transcriptional regulator [Anaerocolumna aminovalerica]SFO52847.1 DNA-binding transcriptional regulator, MerR family [Anaerocolumna aminovalerica]
MLSIGEFSNICKVSTKTLRYYAEIGLILPDEINPENGYRYYSIEQLEKMLFINRLKSYNFSLEEIKTILDSEELQDEKLYLELTRKKKEIEKQVQEFEKTLDQLNNDISNLRQGKSIMSYLESIDVQLVEVPKMYLLSIRKMVHEYEIAEEYGNCFIKLIKKIQEDKLTILAPPMVLFHSAEFSPFGLDTEFAIPVKEYVTGTRDFYPGLCLKTVLYGSYSELSSVYAKQREWAEKEGYECNNALYEVYVTDPSQVLKESELITEIYYPIKKKVSNI